MTHAAAARSIRSTAMIIVAAVVLFIVLAAYMRAVEQRVASPAAAGERFNAAEAARPAAAVREAVRALKLITVEIRSAVTVTEADESWRGDVSATLTAPVRLYFGTDLSAMTADSVSLGPLNEYVVRVPRPRRLATEVFPEEGTPAVRVGWMRLRSMAGEYYLSQARRVIGEKARLMKLSGDQMVQVEQATREQVSALVRAIAGDRARVSVVFTDDGVAAPSSGQRLVVDPSGGSK